MSMTADVVRPLGSAQDSKARDAALPFLAMLAALILYSVLRALLLATAQSSALPCLALDAAAFAGAVALARVRYAQIPVLMHPLMRGIGLVVFVQVVFDSAALLYGPAEFVTGRNGLFFEGGAAIALVSGALGLWRPSFLVPLFFHYVAFRHQIGVITGVDISKTDYLSMLDIGTFLTVGAFVVIALAQPIAARLLPAGVDGSWLRDRTTGLIWACAVGAHLGNYFVSGWTKLQTGGGDKLFWLFHNPTQTSILIGLERGDNPLAAWPWAVQGSWNAMVASGIVLNLFVLGTQLAAPLALARRRGLMLFTLLFDLFHIAVYLTLGALFFFWIAVNIMIYISAKRLNEKSFTPNMKIVALLAIAAGHFFFYTSHLGWIDGAKLASPRFTAETRDGRIASVPSVYFGIASYSIAQTAMFIPEGHFPMRMGGNSYNRADWRDAHSCGAETRPRQDTGVSLPSIFTMVRQTDTAMRQHPAVKDMNLYYIYPHHMVGNPAVFGDFNRLKIGDIVRYHYIVDSVCLHLKDGALVRDVHKTTDYPINVRS
jgi:hypothetical protein